MKNQLLKKAKSHKMLVSIKRNLTPDVVGVAIAWATSDITLSQASFALCTKKHSMSVYIDLARALRQAVQSGKLIVKK